MRTLSTPFPVPWLCALCWGTPWAEGAGQLFGERGADRGPGLLGESLRPTELGGATKEAGLGEKGGWAGSRLAAALPVHRDRRDGVLSQPRHPLPTWRHTHPHTQVSGWEAWGTLRDKVAQTWSQRFESTCTISQPVTLARRVHTAFLICTGGAMSSFLPQGWPRMSKGLEAHVQ